MPQPGATTGREAHQQPPIAGADVQDRQPIGAGRREHGVGQRVEHGVGQQRHRRQCLQACELLLEPFDSGLEGARRRDQRGPERADLGGEVRQRPHRGPPHELLGQPHRGPGVAHRRQRLDRRLALGPPQQPGHVAGPAGYRLADGRLDLPLERCAFIGPPARDP